MFAFKTKIAVAALSGVTLFGLALPEAHAQRGPGTSRARTGFSSKAGPGSVGKGSSVFVPPQFNGRDGWRSRERFRERHAYDPYESYLYGPALLGAMENAAADGSGAAQEDLGGAAAVIQSQGQLMKDQQEAFRMREEVRRLHTENRLLKFVEEQYERENTPTLEERRQQSLLQAQQRAMSDPPLPEIWSGKSLNDLLPLVQNQHSLEVGSDLPLGREVLGHINLTTGSSSNLGLLKNAGQLDWPRALQGAAYATLRGRLDAMTPEALREAKERSQVNPDRLHAMRADVASLNDGLKQRSKELVPTEYIEAKRFLNDLNEAVTALGQYDVAANIHYNEFPGKTVAHLVQHMTVHGLRFAPAVAGDEPAYKALHHALVACVGGPTLISKR